METDGQDTATVLAAALVQGDATCVRALLARANKRILGGAVALLDKDSSRTAFDLLVDILDDEGMDDEEGEDDDYDDVLEARVNAALALGYLHDPRAVEPLLHALAGHQDTLKSFVIDALGIIGDLRALQPLIDALTYVDIDTRKAAMNALVSIGEPSVLPLIELLDTGVDAVIVPTALAMIGDERAVTPLLTVLNNRRRSDVVRYSVAVALGKIGNTSVFDLLSYIAEDETESALVQTGARQGLAYLNQD